jgi:glutamate synthase domain-containing protein 2
MLLSYLMELLMSEKYSENVWETVTATTRTSPNKIIENSLRAQSGQVLERPFGSPRKFLHFDGLIFSPAQLSVMPAPEDAPVRTDVIIGPHAEKPLRLGIPLLIGAMGYGVGVSEKVKIAMAKATAAVDTATNTGEGGFLPEVRQYAKHLIIQYHSGKWTKDPEILRQADAIEIHIGQGASAAAASRIPPDYLRGRARDILGLKPNETAILHSRHPDIQSPADLIRVVSYLREITGGVPIGIKFCAGRYLEDDLDIALEANVDFISIDGSQAGTKGSPPILEDDFGLPTIYALSRAVEHLYARNKADEVSLLIGGGFTNPGECLKALALGADAVYMGTAPLWAMTHTQITKAIPFEPPTQLVFYPGSMTDQFDEEKAAYHLQNFFVSFMEEIKVAVRALGKTSVREVYASDLLSLDEETSRITKIPLAYTFKKQGDAGFAKNWGKS